MALHHIWQNWRDRLTPRRGGDVAARQSGAIPYAIVEGRTVFLIVTSRRTGRWIFPKGSVIAGMTPWESAAQEAYEEAGVEGEIETVPIGAYRDLKTAGIRRLPIEVDLYPLRLVRQCDAWPEQGNRHRHWVIRPDAKRLLSNPRMAELAVLLDRRLAPQGQPDMARISQ